MKSSITIALCVVIPLVFLAISLAFVYCLRRHRNSAQQPAKFKYTVSEDLEKNEKSANTAFITAANTVTAAKTVTSMKPSTAETSNRPSEKSNQQSIGQHLQMKYFKDDLKPKKPDNRRNNVNSAAITSDIMNNKELKSYEQNKRREALNPSSTTNTTTPVIIIDCEDDGGDDEEPAASTGTQDRDQENSCSNINVTNDNSATMLTPVSDISSYGHTSQAFDVTVTTNRSQSTATLEVPSYSYSHSSSSYSSDYSSSSSSSDNSSSCDSGGGSYD
ncbi:hypothetical protein BX616_002908 [Lobosporangium transversale]|uniref:Uncharacterized protein n=1 Tax=Lobosporangium transversale TaxID=64571 RepID=A0A1Y2H0I1_9FUNG|nr:hypothetical protein BCR41DRAFT_346422 [Lobosporangium transversale]KAF9899650.1 hypothetical protein BX616_002908 [Lobosporangium transversale]ORZ28025.1 hypothetical protein BCR41DRAFT_346422 [Lobosporangium transversale]|eukprot:XP_021885728.1 hypothetical protein BCR41DRAFT_346422 [Lobosporangium transversale]